MTFQSLLHQVSGANGEWRKQSPDDPPVSIPSSSGQWCQLGIHPAGDDRDGAVSIPSSSGQWCQQQMPQDIHMRDEWWFQSLLHQVSGANPRMPPGGRRWCRQFQSLLHQVSGANGSKAVRVAGEEAVSIPSSSGQWCQLFLPHRKAVAPRGFNPFFIRSVVPTVNCPYCAERGRSRFNPFFIRSVVPTLHCAQRCQHENKFQSLLHQVSGANLQSTDLLLLRTIRFNPFFIRSVVPTWKCSVCGFKEKYRFNPFFIRSVVPTEGLKDPLDTFNYRFNPFFIRSVVPTHGDCPPL